MVLWETEFYALSILTGNLESFRGLFIEAETLQQALKVLRDKKLDYLQLTGEHFASLQAILDADNFYEKLSSPRDAIKGMSYDEFYAWLDLAPDKETLVETLDTFKGERGMEHYVKVLEIYIRDYEENSGRKEGGEEASNEEVG